MRAASLRQGWLWDSRTMLYAVILRQPRLTVPPVAPTSRHPGGHLHGDRVQVVGLIGPEGGDRKVDSRRRLTATAGNIQPSFELARCRDRPGQQLCHVRSTAGNVSSQRLLLIRLRPVAVYSEPPEDDGSGALRAAKTNPRCPVPSLASSRRARRAPGTPPLRPDLHRGFQRRAHPLVELEQVLDALSLRREALSPSRTRRRPIHGRSLRPAPASRSRSLIVDLES